MLNADSVLEFRSDTATNTVMKKTLDAAMEKFCFGNMRFEVDNFIGHMHARRLIYYSGLEALSSW